MPPCRLCTEASDDFKPVYDESGEGSDIYHIIVRYFDPMLLSSSTMQGSAVICINCWGHINEFYSFEQSILEVQTKLQEDSKIMLPFIKSEDELLNDDNQKTLKSEILLKVVENNKQNLDCSSDDDKPLKLRSKCNTTCTLGSVYKNQKRKTRKSKCSRIAKKSNESPIKREASSPCKETRTNNKEGDKVAAEFEENLKPDANYDGEKEPQCEDNNKRPFKTKQYDEFIYQWKKDLDCVQCSTSCSNLTLLRIHFKREHPETKCFVMCCNRKLFNRCQMVEHIRLHIDPNVFKCNTCGKCASSSRGLKKHIQEQHTEEGQERRHECHICQKRFTKKAILKAHIDTHATGNKDYVCKDCGKGFVLSSRLRAHERTVHNVDCVCDQCGKTIHGKYALKRHLLEHAGIMKRKWACDQCNAELNSHSSLKRHKEAIHHDGNTVYVCSECGKISPSEVALLSHKKYVHQAERKYKCNICDKAFKVAIVLKEHMAAHTGQDLYECPHCPKTFKVSSNMHHHRKRAHPLEWAEARQHRLKTIKKTVTNFNSNKIIL